MIIQYVSSPAESFRWTASRRTDAVKGTGISNGRAWATIQYLESAAAAAAELFAEPYAETPVMI